MFSNIAYQNKKPIKFSTQNDCIQRGKTEENLIIFTVSFVRRNFKLHVTVIMLDYKETLRRS